MRCKDCDRFSDCKYKINSPIWSEAARGIERYISGKDCPKKWQDKKVEDMTVEQLREAVKALRKIVVERITEPVKDIEKNIKDKSEDWKPVFDKPPLGCKPAQLVCTDRIKVVADAISRCAESPKFNSQLVRRWATEIELQCDIFERC